MLTGRVCNCNQKIRFNYGLLLLKLFLKLPELKEFGLMHSLATKSYINFDTAVNTNNTNSKRQSGSDIVYHDY
jgi:hypothetical protein